MKNYLNLTSGLEWASMVDNYGLVRMQSSQCESTRFWSLVLDIDYAFLIDAATQGVILHDCGSRSGDVSRAQWQGVQWLVWAYAKANKQNLPEVRTRRSNPASYFEEFYSFGESDRIRKAAKKKLRYVFRLTNSANLIIKNKSMKSNYDGQTSALAEIAGLRNFV